LVEKLKCQIGEILEDLEAWMYAVEREIVIRATA
jgi:hypothetical protein